MSLKVCTVCGALLLMMAGAQAVALNDEERLHDWAQLQTYASQNISLPPKSPGEQRVVFFGDSITYGWSLTSAFPGKAYINRGIGGQTTPQMLVRFRQDVIDLHPALVVILAGTNDLAQNTGPETLEQIEGYLKSMCELARANDIKIVLSSVLPVDDYPWRRGLNPVGKVKQLNAWLENYAKQSKLGYIDYFSAMANSDGGMRKELSEDGVHPNASGYAIMTPLAEKAIFQTLIAAD